MKIKLGLIILTLTLFGFQTDTFRESQRKFPRVREAYKTKEVNLNELLQQNNIIRNQLKIYLRAFKQEQQIELWGKNKSEEKYKLIKIYGVCESSGGIGPKRKQGDLQVPEGYYHINRFNPYSNFYLSLGINYPNPSDRILGSKTNLGGDIFIHGNCVTVGCLPITDDKIMELYIFCIEAKNNGQSKIPVTIFPAKLSQQKYSALLSEYPNDKDKKGLWTDLKKGYDLFNETKTLPTIGFLNSGRYSVSK